MKKLLCLLLAVLLVLPASGLAKGEPPSSIRVLLRRLALSDRADLTVSGCYLARSDSGAEFLLSDNTKITVLLLDDRLVFYSGGISVSMGKSFSLLRQEGSAVSSGLRFNLQPGFYPGDLLLKIDGGKILPILSLPLETYLQGVVPYEMGEGFPVEALKAQAVCARTFALSRMNAKGSWDVVDTTDDQVFRGLPASAPDSFRAVEETAGLVLTCDNKLITAWYSASNGGQTELPSHVWGGEAPRCFVIQDDPWDAANPNATVRVCTLNRDGSGLSPAFVKMLRKAALADPALQGALPGEEDFRIRQLLSLELVTPRYPSPSRLMTQLRVSFKIVPPEQVPEASSGEEEDLDIRDLLFAMPITVTLDLFPEGMIALGLSVSGANNEIVTLSESDTAFILASGRYGHGVGLSQRGAQQMAGAGKKNFREILSFYYPGAVMKKYTGEAGPLPTPDPRLARDPGPAPTATPRPTLMPVTGDLPEGAWLATVEHIDADSTLNLRAQPSAGAEILMRLYLHQKLVVLEECDVPGWAHVRTDAIEGYVMLSFLEETEDAGPPAG